MILFWRIHEISFQIYLKFEKKNLFKIEMQQKNIIQLLHMK